jgi:hypothetical protein
MTTYKCRTCKQLIENAVTPSGRFIALNAEPDMTGNLTVDRSRTSVTLAVYVSEKEKQRLLTALDGAPCSFYKAHQCTVKEPQ